MKRHPRCATALVVSGCFFALLSTAHTAAAQQQAESPNELVVTVGKSVIVNSALPIERVSVGYGDFAEATAVSPTEVLVNGRAPGQTSLIVWQQGGGKLFFDVTVEPSQFGGASRTDLLRRELNRELPGQKIDVDVQNDLIFLRGSVKDMTSADRALAIAGAMGRPVNLLYVDVPPPETQILLKVKFASVDRNVTRSLGINFFSLGATRTIGTVTTQQFSAPSVSTSVSGGSSGGSGGTNGGGVTTGSVAANISDFLNLFFFRPDLNLGATIRALEQKNLVEILAEPNVLAVNGKQASFLAGGQYPYPVVQGGTIGGTTAVTIQFQRFGVLLNFIPTITPRGTIRLQVAPEVSSLDYANGVTISGFSVPGISVRNVNTEVELSEGQSFAIGGLLDNRETETLDKIPFIGDVPVLGKFFQSKIKNRTNTELMVIVTPEIVRPIPAGQPLPLPNYPVPFLSANTPTPMAAPGQQTTGPVPVTAPTPTVPIETLIKSYQERQLVVQSTTGMFGVGAAGGTGGPQTAPAAPTPAPGPAPAAPTPPPQ